MPDVVVTVPKRFEYDGFRGLAAWAAEGCLPGEADNGEIYEFTTGGCRPQIKPGERVYIVCEDRVRGFAPLVGLVFEPYNPMGGMKRGRVRLLRGGNAEAVTIPERVIGFRGWRYRWWDRADEVPFPDWLPETHRTLIRDYLDEMPNDPQPRGIKDALMDYIAIEKRGGPVLGPELEAIAHTRFGRTPTSLTARLRELRQEGYLSQIKAHMGSGEREFVAYTCSPPQHEAWKAKTRERDKGPATRRLEAEDAPEMQLTLGDMGAGKRRWQRG